MILNELIREKNWHEVEVLLHLKNFKETNFKLAKRRKLKSASSPLYLACLHRAPYRVIKILLDTFCDCKQNAFSDSNLLTSQDPQGWTALHIAVLYGVEDEALLLLIDACSIYGALSIRNEFGWTPLLLALRYGSSTRIIKALLEADVSSVTIANQSGTSPLFMRWCAWQKIDNVLARSAIAFNPRTSIHAVDNPNNLSGSFRKCWDDMLCLLKAASFHYEAKLHRKRNSCVKEDSLGPFHNYYFWQLYLLHACIKYGAPFDFIRLVMKIHPEQISRTDLNGNAPLHIAVNSFHSHEVEALMNIIDDLVNAFPEAASKVDSSNRYPLNALAENGVPWSSGVESIFKAAPEIASLRDIPSGGLYSFMIGAASSKSNFDTVYALLRSNPSILSYS